MLEQVIEVILPVLISAAELIGIFVVTVSVARAFWHYLLMLVGVKGKHYAVKFELANGMATGLEFKMAAEILKTVQVRNLNELAVLGAIILLRALLSFMIHIEMKNGPEEENPTPAEAEKK
ncbi:MAG TPA: DUF1622 domain-containing protein [Candidatus Pygmaiobacter gallistercoris]|nr:DUF1622 domain-containing protein [Candidatus Pygmaiobacter gallistercoris]